MNYSQLKNFIISNDFTPALAALYGEENVSIQRERYIGALEAFVSQYGHEHDMNIFSIPGRSELSGNHTDHNRGCVIATAIDLDIIAVAAKTDDGTITFTSSGFGTDNVILSEYTSPDSTYFGTSKSIIAGMSAGMKNAGYKTGGFCAYATSNVLRGSGLSSSAAFENTVGTIINHLYNDGKADNVEIAKISQYAENAFFGKPCGLMDQVACAVGGIVAIDFCDSSNPKIQPIDFDLTAKGYKLCIVNTGGNHADLTDDYASVPFEMKAVANSLGVNVLREISEDEVIKNIPRLRETLGDRAIMRALHFFEENKRVSLQKQALLSNDLNAYFENVHASGQSSFCYLQNVYTTKNLTEQGLSLALCMCSCLLDKNTCAWRVHGGGFAGTIQVYLPANEVEGFKNAMENAFGDGACNILSVRRQGAIKVI